MGAGTFQKVVRLELKNERAGAKIEAPRGVCGGGFPVPSRLGGLRERRELPQRGPGRSPRRQPIFSIF